MKTPVQNVPVGPEEAGQKLLQYLVRRLGGQAPQSAILRWIRTGQVRVDGGRAKPFDRLKHGALVRIPPFEPGKPQGKPAPAQNAPLDIIFENEELLVIAKPSGLPTHPGSGWDDSVQTRLKARYVDAPFSPTPAHRLDKNTSGLLLAAKTYDALRRLQDAFRDKTADKTYLAWVKGAWNLSLLNTPVTLTDQLEKSGAPGKQKMRTGHGKNAVTIATPIRIDKNASLLSLRILTGRTHQIRAQLASRNFPIIGDVKYGGGASPMLLHAYCIAIDGHEFTLPPDWPVDWMRGVDEASGRENSMPSVTPFFP